VNPFSIPKTIPASILNNPKNAPVALLDLDRTICDNNRFYVPADLNEYLTDKANPLIHEAVQKLMKEVHIVVISCRPKSALFHSRQWLSAHNIFPLLILHRDEEDCREDWIIKQEMLITRVFPTMYVKIAFDDKICIRSMYEKYGINTFKF
jgi:hypothetical protein